MSLPVDTTSQVFFFFFISGQKAGFQKMERQQGAFLSTPLCILNRRATLSKYFPEISGLISV